MTLYFVQKVSFADLLKIYIYIIFYYYKCIYFIYLFFLQSGLNKLVNIKLRVYEVSMKATREYSERMSVRVYYKYYSQPSRRFCTWQRLKHSLSQPRGAK